MSAPSAWQLEQAIKAWQLARERLLADDDVGADEAVLAELLGPETADVETMLDRVLRAATHAEDMAALAEARIVDLETRRDRYRKRAEATRTAAYQIMETIGRKRHEMPEMTATVRPGTLSVFIIDEASVPGSFVRIRTERSYDKKAIKEALLLRRAAEDEAQGEVTDELPPDVPGATLSNGPATLQIRRR